MAETLIVFVTASRDEEALRIARAVVDEKLAACAGIIPSIRSIYRWKGEICDAEERLLIIKSRFELFPTLQQRIKQLHSYEVPEIIGIPIRVGSEDYLNWLLENTLGGQGTDSEE